MPYIPNTDTDREEMLKTIGASSFEELVSNIPAKLRLKGPLDLPPALSEWEITKELKRLSSKNISSNSHLCFLGGGAYDHFIPSAIDSIVSRPEFYTAYTPYQAELSQGTLQAMYEFQSCVCELSGMEVSNASMYDGASALAEAVIMASNLNKGFKVLITQTVHPHYKEVIKTYLTGTHLQLIEISEKDGITDLICLTNNLSNEVSSVVIQHPNFLGNLEEVNEIEKKIRQFPDVKYIVSFNPISTGLIDPPGNYGADIATCEGQPLGIPLSLGGPYLGIFTTRQSYIRKMPGRMSGKTIDAKGQDGFTLTLQTREQHIKREKATSNICTNQGLMSLTALLYLSLMGKAGIKEVAELSYNNAHYLAKQLCTVSGVKLKFNQEFFNEFVIESSVKTEFLIHFLEQRGILAGIDLTKFGYNGLLIAVTEKRSKEEMDRFVEGVRMIIK
ncbi:MAG: glycine dehydrogenase (aminomethyl-transferring) [Bacteroidetes bacterium RIFCSPLOWO2_02_FULL_36_8]|nr:MAG: glycine dehydrogenase (aminomethyl-transferring) [Bacteroidetes bacterium RIFCSPLOWO2_02_FULL_36_8]